MSANLGLGAARVASNATLEERLERGEVIHFAACPFPLPQGDDHQFLLQQRLASRAHKNIGYNPIDGKTTGFRRRSPQQADRLQKLLSQFADNATQWLAKTLPCYAQSWQRDRVSFRPEEEATRKLRITARNDLLHVDAFPSRPTQGYRILRLFANINLTEPRVWITSDPFAKLLEKYGGEVGLPGRESLAWFKSLREGLLKLFVDSRRQRTVYDSFMLRFHDFMKKNDYFQEQCKKKFWHFLPGSAWMVFTDTASHAALRGRFALEHSYFVAAHSLVLPQESPAALLEKACGMPVLRKAG